ncbi:MAG TPA: hypothetical protein VM580_23460, partial [Labilithrix sp.]|nr:hypothetical protein [Labilithrix sp.]
TLVNEAIDFTKLRPVPLRRLFELDETTRNALELIREGSQHPIANLVNVGLPAHGDLARFLGHAPPELLDTPVMLDGQAHPASFIVSDAVHDLRPYDDAIAALLTLPAETLVRLWSALAKLPPKGPLTGAYAAPPKGAQRGSPAATGAHAQRYVRFLTALGQRLPDRGERAARAILTERADWVGRWLPQLTERPAMAVPHWLEQCVALALLARNARSAAEGAGELDPTHDALLSSLALYHDASYPLAVVLEDLAPARAGRIACAQLELIERFPSTEGAEAAVRLFEKSGGGPYMGALFRRVIAAIGLPARAALESAIARGSPQLRTLKECSSALAKTAQGTKKPETKTRATR